MQSITHSKHSARTAEKDVIDELLANGSQPKQVVNSGMEHWRAVAIASLFAQGCTPEEIAVVTGLSQEQTEFFLTTPAVERELARIAVRLDLPVEEFIAGSEKQAAFTIRNLLIAKGVKDETRLKAAQDIIDRSKGRAVQRVQSFNVNAMPKDISVLDENIRKAAERVAALESSFHATKSN